MTVQTRAPWLTPAMTRTMHDCATTPAEQALMARFWLRGMSKRAYATLTVDEQAMIAGLMVRAVHRLREEVNG